MKEKDVIELENGNKYYLIKQINYREEMYFFAAPADEENKMIPNRKIIFKIIFDENEKYIEPVTDKEILTALVNILKDTMN